MKKFTFILSLLLTCAGITTSAQTCNVKKFSTSGTAITSVDDLTDEGLYAFLSTGKNKYIKLDVSNFKLNNDASLENTDDTDAYSVFKIHITTDGDSKKYSFETVLTNVYMKPVVDGACYAEYTTSPATFEIRTANVDGAEQETGTFCIKNSGNNQWFDMQNDQFVGWQGRGSNCGYKIVPVTVSDEVLTTYHYATHKMQLSDGTAVTSYPAPFEAKYYEDNTTLPITIPTLPNFSITQKTESGVVSATNTEIVFEATRSETVFPVIFSTADSKTWYNIFIFTNDNANPNATRTLKAVAEDNTCHVQSTPSRFTATDLRGYDAYNSAVWDFYESGLGVKLHNKGTDKYLKWVSDCAELVDENSATTLYITENTSNTGGYSGFGLWTGTGDQYLNASVTKNNVANARLGVWNAADSKNNHGSRFIVNAIDNDLLAVGLECIKNPVANEVNETYVTAGLTEDISRAAAKLEGVTVSSWEELDAANVTFNEELTKPAADIDPNAVYRISNVNVTATQPKYASTTTVSVATDGTLESAWELDENTFREVNRVAESADFMPQLWRFKANTDGTYKIIAANVGAWWSSDAPIKLTVKEGWAGDFAIKSVPGATFTNNATNDYTTMFQLLQGGTIRMNALSGWAGTTIGSYGSNHDRDAGNYWQIEKVTSIPVAIGETGYASVGYPFAVQLPAGDVKAYYGSQAANGVLTLTPIEDGIIPANTGVILVNESEAGGAANVTLTITTTDKVISDNKLEATAAKRTGFEANSNYLLAKDADEQVKFLQAEITTVPANKAYLPVANLSGNNANALAFSFGETTGINTVETAQESKNVKYYDLKGRAVLNPSHGVFITNTGKKVLIK